VHFGGRSSAPDEGQIAVAAEGKQVSGEQYVGSENGEEGAEYESCGGTLRGAHEVPRGAECGEGEGYALASIDPMVIERVRSAVPSLKHRRL